jgi:DNA-directed RNA polymerase specialized sigma24 family protein
MRKINKPATKAGQKPTPQKSLYCIASELAVNRLNRRRAMVPESTTFKSTEPESTVSGPKLPGTYYTTPTNAGSPVCMIPTDIDPEAQYQQTTSPLLLSTINPLPKLARLTFLMRYVDNMNYQQISQILDVSIRSVEENLVIALRQLKDSLPSQPSLMDKNR